jgi:antitoxin (DNA-binding transcriptional repressor) of toxin-antitoxin stability system
MRPSRTKGSVKFAAVTMAVCALGLAIALPASGHKVTYASNLQLKLETLNNTTEQFSGKVTSTKAACKAGRTITITQAGTPIATTVSNVSGDWAVTGPVPPKGTEITASTPKKFLKRNKKHRHKCGPAAATHRAN